MANYLASSRPRFLHGSSIFKICPEVTSQLFGDLRIGMNVIISVFSPLFLWANSPLYNIEDLMALEKSKKYREFILHAHDIRPSKRDASWDKMLKHMATGFVSQALLDSSFDDQTFDFIQNFAQWMELKEDVYFHTKREQYVIKYLENCLRKKTFEHCQENAKNSWKLYRKNRDTGILMAKLLFGKKKEKTDVFYFINDAIKSEFSGFYCKESFVKQAILDKIYQKTLGMEEPKSIVSAIDKFIAKECFNIIAQTLLKNLEDSNRIIRDFSYKILAAKKRLSRDQEDFYLARFFLDSPTKGRILNLSWAKLKEISQDYKRREILVKKLKQLDPLPDNLFQSNDQLKKKTLAAHLYKTLPEFMDYYVKSCLEYLAGEGFYPNGNPTVHCDNFFQATEQSPLPDQKIRVRYSGLKKFRYTTKPTKSTSTKRL